MNIQLGVVASVDIEPRSVFDDGKYEVIHTSFGHKAAWGTVGGSESVLLSRAPLSSPKLPNRISWREIISWLQELQVKRIVATGMVGSLRSDLPPGVIVIADQFLDFTKQRPQSLYRDERFAFVDFTDPFCESLRSGLATACRDTGLEFRDRGCYVCVDGPRFETRAEVNMYGMLGGDVIGMTAIPECIMAREAGICYSMLSAVVNFGAGISGAPLSAAEFVPYRSVGLAQIAPVIRQAASLWNDDCNCPKPTFELGRQNDI